MLCIVPQSLLQHLFPNLAIYLANETVTIALDIRLSWLLEASTDDYCEQFGWGGKSGSPVSIIKIIFFSLQEAIFLKLLYESHLFSLGRKKKNPYYIMALQHI